MNPNSFFVETVQGISRHGLEMNRFKPGENIRRISATACSFALPTVSWATLACLLLYFSGQPVLSADPINFNDDVRPLLSRYCFACHGPDENSREADLRLDTREGAIADLGEHQVIHPGKPESSELIRRINSQDPEIVMPPRDTGHELTEAERRLLYDWIANGADYSTHW